MRFVQRGNTAPPKALTAKNRSKKTELELARAHFQNPSGGSFDFKRYRDPEVKSRLEKLFYGKCAYCETFYASSGPVDVEHYRPKAGVSDPNAVGHPGYWWLAMDWENLLPSCLDCNRRRGQRIYTLSSSLTALQISLKVVQDQTGKGNCFPISGVRASKENASLANEQAVLLNPCRDDPADHLQFYINRNSPLGLILPARGSIRGAESIHIYGLNRVKLVQDRTRVLRQLEILAIVVIEVSKLMDDIHHNRDSIPPHLESRFSKALDDLQKRVLQEMKNMARPSAPYSTMVSEWISEFKKSF